jgi:transcriptional regulator with GAF, ATPase, and Fis domain
MLTTRNYTRSDPRFDRAHAIEAALQQRPRATYRFIATQFGVTTQRVQQIMARLRMNGFVEEVVTKVPKVPRKTLADFADTPTLELLEKRHVLHVLEATDHNCVLAAVVLGIGKTTLYRRLKEWGFEAGQVGEQVGEPEVPTILSLYEKEI